MHDCKARGKSNKLALALVAFIVVGSNTTAGRSFKGFTQAGYPLTGDGIEVNS